MDIRYDDCFLWRLWQEKKHIAVALCYSSYSMQGMAGKEMTSMIVISCGDFLKLADFGFGIKVGILAFLGCLREALYEDQEPSYVRGCFAGYFLAQLPRERLLEHWLWERFPTYQQAWSFGAYIKAADRLTKKGAMSMDVFMGVFSPPWIVVGLLCVYLIYTTTFFFFYSPLASVRYLSHPFVVMHFHY